MHEAPQPIGSPLVRGHAAALLTVLIWGVTFISTKVLLEDFSPVQILVIRFAIGYLALALIRPRPLRTRSWRDEALFAGAGICGIGLAFLFENYALMYASASNTSLIVATSPFFMGLITRFILKEGRLGGWFFAGFACAMAGIALITLVGTGELGFSGLGELLALLASVVDAFYTVLCAQIGKRGCYGTVETTKRMFAWGLAFLIPYTLLSEVAPGNIDLTAFSSSLLKPSNVANLLFLALGASALCYATWNKATRELGARRVGPYIYLIPVVTVVVAAAVLGEPLTWASVLGSMLVIAGLALSERGR